jgi:hypothetical protein
VILQGQQISDAGKQLSPCRFKRDVRKRRRLSEFPRLPGDRNVRTRDTDETDQTELNATERIWNYTRKNVTHNRFFEQPQDLCDLLFRNFDYVRHNPQEIENLLRPFFDHHVELIMRDYIEFQIMTTELHWPAIAVRLLLTVLAGAVLREQNVAKAVIPPDCGLRFS